MSDSKADTGAAPYSKEELKKALKAFKKRLKLQRLDEESRSAFGPLSGGRSSGIVGIYPPEQFPVDIWPQLVEKGRLVDSGRGLYELPPRP